MPEFLVNESFSNIESIDVNDNDLFLQADVLDESSIELDGSTGGAVVAFGTDSDDEIDLTDLSFTTAFTDDSDGLFINPGAGDDEVTLATGEDFSLAYVDEENADGDTFSNFATGDSLAFDLVDGDDADGAFNFAQTTGDIHFLASSAGDAATLGFTADTETSLTGADGYFATADDWDSFVSDLASALEGQTAIEGITAGDDDSTLLAFGAGTGGELWAAKVDAGSITSGMTAGDIEEYITQEMEIDVQGISEDQIMFAGETGLFS